jgi:hypothetical protein
MFAAAQVSVVGLEPEPRRQVPVTIAPPGGEHLDGDRTCELVRDRLVADVVGCEISLLEVPAPGNC